MADHRAGCSVIRDWVLRGKPIECLFAVLLVYHFVFPESRAADAISQQQLAAQLEHQRRLVRSMECAYDHERYPTAPDQVALLRRKYPKANSRATVLIRTWEGSRRQTHSAKWWRKGEKERWDETYPHTGKTLSKAFDGHLVRVVERNDSKVSASLWRLEKSHLLDTVRDQPFALVYEVAAKPLSEIVRKGTEYSAVKIDVRGETHRRVFVKNAQDRYCLLCTFDQEDRMTEWSYLDLSSTRENPIIVQTHGLLDYRGYPDPSGETIWFPSQVQSQHFDPATKDGPAAVWGAQTVTFRDVRFNVVVPDSQFVIPLPVDAHVYDDVTGQGFLEPGTPLAAWDAPPPPPAARSWRWLWLAGCVLLALFALAASFYFRRSRAARASTGA